MFCLCIEAIVLLSDQNRKQEREKERSAVEMRRKRGLRRKRRTRRKEGRTDRVRKCTGKIDENIGGCYERKRDRGVGKRRR